MIENFNDLEITGEETEEQVDALLQQKLGIGFTDMRQRLSAFLAEHAGEVAKDFAVVVPHGNYDELIEDAAAIVEFFQQQASQVQAWIPIEVAPSHSVDNLKILNITFVNEAVEELVGHVFVNFSGKVLHVFLQGDA